MAKRAFDRVGVLGAGIMGTGIACHLANAGVRVVLLDIPPPGGKGSRNALAEGALQKALKSNPKSLFHPSRASLIQVGNLEDDLGQLADCDWIVEAVKEDLGIKRKLFEQLEKVAGPGAILASNTSGIPLAQLVEGRSSSFRERFLITHFFNPVRYMKLLELVSGPDTAEWVKTSITAFAEDVLGKGVVWAKDTPNFIANRIGTYGMMRVLKEMETQNASIEEVDAIFGKALGRPKSAVFQTGDLVGVDLLEAVAENCYRGLPNDPERDLYQPPAWVKQLVQSGHLGRKTPEKGGFYRKAEKSPANPKGLEVWDPKKNTYRGLEKVRIDSLGAVRNMDQAADRMRTVVFADDRAGKIAWPVMRDSLVYAMRLLGEIADDVVSIDEGMRWGFNWDLGPFESWDALGFKKVAERIKADGIALSPWVEKLLREGKESIYASVADPQPDSRRWSLAERKKRGAAIVKSNSGASLVDIGDGVFAVEFHTKANAIDPDIGQMLADGIDYAEANGHGLVIYNEGENFSVGANLMLIYMLAQAAEWKQLDEAILRLQQVMQKIRYAKVPVVAAPHQMALGGGCEICLAAGSAGNMVPTGELYIGLVEVGVGVIPAAGGTVNTLFGFLERIPEGAQVDPLAFVAQAFQQIATASVATSAEEGRAKGYVPLGARISMDRRRQLHDAKQWALGLARGSYRPPLPRAFLLPGESGIATLKTMVTGMVQSGHATEHDAKIAAKLAEVLCGGRSGHVAPVTEDRMLELEREAFLSLAGEKKSQERMAYILTENKPLRN